MTPPLLCLLAFDPLKAVSRDRTYSKVDTQLQTEDSAQDAS